MRAHPNKSDDDTYPTQVAWTPP